MEGWFLPVVQRITVKLQRLELVFGNARRPGGKWSGPLLGAGIQERLASHARQQGLEYARALRRKEGGWRSWRKERVGAFYVWQRRVKTDDRNRCHSFGHLRRATCLGLDRRPGRRTDLGFVHEN